MSDVIINPAALEPPFGPSDIPTHHRVRCKIKGAPAEVLQGRRPSRIGIVQNLRHDVAEWREAQYGGASDTTIELLNHWFHRDHQVTTPDGDAIPFSYYFCQREAVETLVYLYEVRGVRSLAGLLAEFGGPEREIAALGIDPEEDQWPRYAFKVATGAGKTKIMSLAIVWSYFHALRESDSPMARHFVIIAPGITVFERLKEDFGNGRIFDQDPLIPSHWRGDWNMSVVLQDEAGGAATGGTIYLTNIHRLYDTTSRRSREPETYEFMGPTVSKAKALDTGQALRERITSHPRLMVLNDEAHHVWDPDSAWNEGIAFLHETTRKRGGGIVAQLDFSATPKDSKGNVFRHVVCDTPLGEAVDAGIVKTPVIGHGDELVERAHPDAAYRYDHHLTLGYKRWLRSKEEWERSGKKPLLFVMTESTEAADGIAKRLNSDPVFQELNGKTINLHTNLKGRLVKRGRGATAQYEFVENEKAISDDDLKALRKLSRELDDSTSPYRCIVSVLMLREGWDVRNVTTIVPLRPLSAESRILPEQTLGRGLRRMIPPSQGQLPEVVTVVEHKAFTDLYRDELSQEGLPLPEVDLDDVPPTTVTIYPNAANKDLQALDLLIPRLAQGYRIDPELADLAFEELRDAFQRHFKPLPLGKAVKDEIQYEGRHLITDEIVEQMRIKLTLLTDGMGAVSFFREELERAAHIRGQHAKLAPHVQRFIEEVLFGQEVSLYDTRVIARLADADVREHVRGTFVPIILHKITRKEQRLREEAPQSVCAWKPYQATHSERRPTETAARTPFNLVPCNNQLEVAFTHFADFGNDVTAFAKNAGPQALRIDYLTTEGRRAIYTPDFLARMADGAYLLVETKGRADKDVPAKAKAAVEWCKAASTKKTRWEYLFIPQNVFEQVRSNSIAELARACAPSLAELIRETESPQLVLDFEKPDEVRVAEQVKAFIPTDAFERLPLRYRKALEHAVSLFHFHENKTPVSFAPVFQPLLGPIDHAAETLLLSRLSGDVPAEAAAQKDYFEPDMVSLKRTSVDFLKERARSLKRLLVHQSPIMPTGLLGFCLEYASKDTEPLAGIFASIRRRFADLKGTGVKVLLDQVYEFRNTFIAHAKQELTDPAVTRAALETWAKALETLHAALAPQG
ncbi:MAG: DEAD/DEAH box helicase family protein [Planctomycetota bacterium]